MFSLREKWMAWLVKKEDKLADLSEKSKIKCAALLGDADADDLVEISSFGDGATQDSVGGVGRQCLPCRLPS